MTSTRRRLLGTTGGLIAAGTAGCLGRGLGGQDDEDGGDAYTVEIAPVGTVEFDSVPERWFPYTGDYADMGVALGHGDGLLAVGIKNRFQSEFYEELPGVSVDKSELTALWNDGTDVEVFYELDADVHLIDPNFMINRISWEQADVDEVASEIAPFAGNTVFSGGYSWHDYEYYSLYEALETVAEIFQERERYEAFAELHDEVQSDLAERLPDERPDVAVLSPAAEEPTQFLPFQIDEGTSFKQYRDLEVGDALAAAGVKDFHETRSELDLEALAEVDPEVIAIRRNDLTDRETFESEIVAFLEDHPVGSELTAVQEGRVVRGGAAYQGPIVHLFQLERLAADAFPDVVSEGELFDRERVASIVTDDD